MPLKMASPEREDALVHGSPVSPITLKVKRPQLSQVQVYPEPFLSKEIVNPGPAPAGSGHRINHHALKEER